MNKNYAIHSEDSFLLMRMYTDLRLHGLKPGPNSVAWNKIFDPFGEENEPENSADYLHTDQLKFHLHGEHVTALFHLTESNYLQVLEELLA